jgi:hypothetical protein
MNRAFKFAAKSLSLSLFATAFGLAACSSRTEPPGAVEQVGEAKGALQNAPTPLGCDTAECCPPGTTPVVFDDASNIINDATPNRCLVMLGGNDSVFSSGAGSAILGGPGDENIQAGPGSQVRGGDGRDTINGFSGATVLGNGGDDTIMAANGDNFIYPGAGIDNVSGGTGNDTVVIYDLCEVSFGDMMEGSGGTNTLITPVPVAQLQAMGVTVSHFQNVIVQANSCKSDCSVKPDCHGNGVCVEGPTTGQTQCQCNPGFSPPFCDGCPAGSPKSAPGQCGCALPDTDSDSDGVANCRDACPNDPAKTSPGLCGCGKPETDSDTDGIPDCIEGVCSHDPGKSVPGQCGCLGDTTLRPANTPCTDGPCRSNTPATCNGSGQCGGTECRPAAGCFYREFRDHIYWFCTGAVTWAQASQNCRAVAGRSLARINDFGENVFVSNVVGSSTPAFTTDAWIGANDQTVENTWRWATGTTNDGDQFWTGGPSGQPFNGRFNSWAASQPGVEDCGAVVRGSPPGKWAARSCTTSLGYVCEEPKQSTPPTPPNIDCLRFFPARFCTPVKEDPNCVPASAALPFTEQEAEAQIKACNAAPNCTESNQSGCGPCTGVASVPPPGNNCAPFEDEEQGFCKLGNIKTTAANGQPCVDGKDCCSATASALIGQLNPDPRGGGLIGEGFETNTAGFAFVDDTFRGTAQPGFASGQRVTTGGNPGAALQVVLGGINNNTINNMSGGWRITFNLAQAALVGVTFDYNLTQSPNYESDELSQVLVSVDGALKGEPFKDFVNQVAGDGNGGPNVTTGFRTFQRSLGILAAGSHTLTIGGFNNKKTAADESTTVLIDNVKLESRVSDCPSGFICGPVYPNDGNCNACDEHLDPSDPTKCTKKCAGMLRCGKPFVDSSVPGTKACANTGLFGTGRCQQTEICAAPEAEGTSDPNGPGADLTPQTFDPAVFGTPAAPAPVYPTDPPCPNPPCASGQNHNWCFYNVDDKLPETPVGPDSKQGGNGGGPVTFSFDPDTTLDFETKPLALGEADFSLDASASFNAKVAFDLGFGVSGNVDVVSAKAALHADRCQATTGDSHLTIFGEDFTPDGLRFDTANQDDMDLIGLTALDPALCRNVDIAGYIKAVNRVKKAYRDALELIRLYKEFKDSQGTAAAKRFSDDFCGKLLADPPEFFPRSNLCAPGETAATTINRFIEYYRGEAERHLGPAQDDLDKKVAAFPIPLLSLRSPPARETQTIANAFFPIGPIPMTLQVEAFAEYGLDGGLTFDLQPGALINKLGGAQPLAFVEAYATPYALAGTSLFVGVGFGFNGFDVSAGIEGAITLGRIGINNTAGAGIAVRAVDDTRDFPTDIAAAAVPGAATSHSTIFPLGIAKNYDYSFQYRYGSTVDLSQILSGTIAGRVRVKIAFFSKTWRRVVLRFPGFGPLKIDLISGGGGSAAESERGDGPKWGTAQMPLPFAQLAPLPASEVLEGDQVPVSNLTTNVEEFFYDSLCQCKKDGEDCFRRGDCCNDMAGSGCLRDTTRPGKKICSPCRSDGVACTEDSECCASTPICFNDPGTAGFFCRACRKHGESCFPSNPEQCCPGTKFGCIIPPGKSKGECRTCIELGDNIPCKTGSDCCSHTCQRAQPTDPTGVCAPEPPQ